MLTFLNRLINPKPPKEYFKEAMDEVLSQEVDPATFARAMADSGGSKNATRALYIKYRAHELHQLSKSGSNAPEAKLQSESTKSSKELQLEEFLRCHPRAGQLNNVNLEQVFQLFLRGTDPGPVISNLILKQESELQRATDKDFRIAIILIILFAAILLLIILKT